MVYNSIPGGFSGGLNDNTWGNQIRKILLSFLACTLKSRTVGVRQILFFNVDCGIYGCFSCFSTFHYVLVSNFFDMGLLGMI